MTDSNIVFLTVLVFSMEIVAKIEIYNLAKTEVIVYILNCYLKSKSELI